MTNVALFGSDRRSRNANVCPSGTNLSKALNLHHYGLDLQGVFKRSSSILLEVFRLSSIAINS